MTQDTDDLDFYRQAVNIILEWLPSEEIRNIFSELELDEKLFDELDDKSKFFYLLRYIEIRYVKLRWRIESVLTKSSELPLKEGNLKDIDILDVHGQNKTLKELSGDFKSELGDIDPKIAFEEMLNQIGFQSKYREYENNLKEYLSYETKNIKYRKLDSGDL